MYTCAHRENYKDCCSLLSSIQHQIKQNYNNILNLQCVDQSLIHMLWLELIICSLVCSEIALHVVHVTKEDGQLMRLSFLNLKTELWVKLLIPFCHDMKETYFWYFVVMLFLFPCRDSLDLVILPAFDALCAFVSAILMFDDIRLRVCAYFWECQCLNSLISGVCSFFFSQKTLKKIFMPLLSFLRVQQCSIVHFHNFYTKKSS